MNENILNKHFNLIKNSLKTKDAFDNLLKLLNNLLKKFQNNVESINSFTYQEKIYDFRQGIKNNIIEISKSFFSKYDDSFFKWLKKVYLKNKTEIEYINLINILIYILFNSRSEIIYEFNKREPKSYFFKEIFGHIGNIKIKFSEAVKFIEMYEYKFDWNKFYFEPTKEKHILNEIGSRTFEEFYYLCKSSEKLIDKESYMTNITTKMNHILEKSNQNESRKKLLEIFEGKFLNQIYGKANGYWRHEKYDKGTEEEKKYTIEYSNFNESEKICNINLFLNYFLGILLFFKQQGYEKLIIKTFDIEGVE